MSFIGNGRICGFDSADTTYLERHDCISLLDRPIGEPDTVADAIRWPVLKPDRDVRGFQSVLLDLGARLGLPGMVDDDGEPAYADYADYMTKHQRKPGIGPLAGFRGKDGDAAGRGEPNPDQVQQYIENGGSGQKNYRKRFFLNGKQPLSRFCRSNGIL